MKISNVFIFVCMSVLLTSCDWFRKKDNPAPQAIIPEPTIRVVRWISPVTKDFETVTEKNHPDDKMISFGYETKTFQFMAFENPPLESNSTKVNRWTMPKCAGSIVIAEHEISDEQMASFGYKNKEFMFYAYKTKPSNGNYIEVSRWTNAKAKGDECRDFTLTIGDGELTETQLVSYGYTDKKVQFYVPKL